jgi:GxxExxY protein
VENLLGGQILDAATKVHRILGPGMLESVYERCLARELLKAGIAFDRQLSLPVVYDGETIESAYKIDLLVGGVVIVEIKSVDRLLDVHRRQLLSYMKLGRYRLGYLINFNVPLLKEGICRMVNGL